ncbi:MAG: DNA primase small subunit PriS [Thaumarchaeota archaeon]|nr:DNA primase small subunit PriS [Nitrososphaerota archaeon]
MSFLKPEDAAFVQKYFKQYYLGKPEVYIPERLPEREFGYFTFREKIMIRHLSFNSAGELLDLLGEKAPLHVYHSSAFYKYPRAPMEEKGWLGSELVFDIDADHLETRCGKSHDFKVCRNCFEAFPADVERCPRCGGQLEKVEWVCSDCLEAARAEARKLLEILESDLGFRRIRLAFSGNRGYHVVVSDEEILDLDQRERKEIIDYVTGMGLSFRLLGLERRGIAPDVVEPGWRGRITRSAIELVISAEVEEIGRLAKASKIRDLKEEVERLRELVGDSLPWSLLKPSVRRVLAEAARENAAAHIDVVVTQDVHRLIRLTGSLNGKTGLKASAIDPNDLDDFDPSSDPVALPMDDEVHVRLIRSHELELGGFKLEPTSNRILRLPIAVAILLICRGVATLP